MRMVEAGRSAQLGSECLSVVMSGTWRNICGDCWEKSDVGRIKINKIVWCEPVWFVEHVQLLSRLFFFKEMVWQEDDIGHSMLTIHVNASVWSLGIWLLSEKRGYQCLTNAIFFFEAPVVCSAIHILECFPGETCLLVATDNTNMFDIFALLSTQPHPHLGGQCSLVMWHWPQSCLYSGTTQPHHQHSIVIPKWSHSSCHSDWTIYTPLGCAGGCKKWYQYPLCPGNLPGLLGH